MSTTNIRQPETRHIQWDDWGAMTREICYSWLAIPDLNLLSGARFIHRPGTRKCIDVWDFGRARVMQQQTYDLEPVPFVREKAALPTKISGGIDAAIAEDVIVIYEASIIIAYLSISVQPICTFRVIFSPVTANRCFIS